MNKEFHSQQSKTDGALKLKRVFWRNKEQSVTGE